VPLHTGRIPYSAKYCEEQRMSNQRRPFVAL
jgi:hypothetical protein